MMSDTPQYEPLEILLVEDEPSDISLFRIAFDQAKVPNRVHVAKDGEEAMEFLRKQGMFVDMPRPNLVVLDLNMPKMNGHEVLAEIRTDEELSDLPVVILTTSKNPEDLVRAEQYKADGFINKSLDLSLDEFLLQFAEKSGPVSPADESG